jgi:hypothetical protein
VGGRHRCAQRLGDLAAQGRRIAACRQ